MTWKTGAAPRPEEASKSEGADHPGAGKPAGGQAAGRRPLTARELAEFEMELIVGGLRRAPARRGDEG